MKIHDFNVKNGEKVVSYSGNAKNCNEDNEAEQSFPVLAAKKLALEVRRGNFFQTLFYKNVLMKLENMSLWPQFPQFYNVLIRTNKSGSNQREQYQ